MILTDTDGSPEEQAFRGGGLQRNAYKGELCVRVHVRVHGLSLTPEWEFNVRGEISGAWGCRASRRSRSSRRSRWAQSKNTSRVHRVCPQELACSELHRRHLPTKQISSNNQNESWNPEMRRGGWREFAPPTSTMCRKWAGQRKGRFVQSRKIHLSCWWGGSVIKPSEEEDVMWSSAVRRVWVGSAPRDPCRRRWRFSLAFLQTCVSLRRTLLHRLREGEDLDSCLQEPFFCLRTTLMSMSAPPSLTAPLAAAQPLCPRGAFSPAAAAGWTSDRQLIAF